MVSQITKLINRVNLGGLLAYLSVFAVLTATAAPLPNSGTVIQSIPPQSTPQKALPKLPESGLQQNNNDDSDSPKIIVKHLKFDGNTVYSEAILIKVLGFKDSLENPFSINELKNLANQITNYYRKNGYFLTQAYLPPQDLVDGTILIKVLEGKYGHIKFQNNTKIKDLVIKNTTQDLKTGALIDMQGLERTLLLLNDLPSAIVKSNLKPGTAVGSSDIDFLLERISSVNGYATLDNSGNTYTGANRLGIQVNLNEMAGLGDSLSFYGLKSSGGMRYSRLSYQIQPSVLRYGLSHTEVEYSLGGKFVSLEAHGTMDINSANIGYPIIRSRDRNVTIQANLDYKQAHDTIDSLLTFTDKKVNVFYVQLLGDFKDNWLSASETHYTFSVSSGQVKIQSATALLADNSTAQSNGRYRKANLTLNRDQTVGETIFSAALTAQYASKNMDATEKMLLGGPSGVRIYPVGEGTGDQGYLASLESKTIVNRWSPLPGLTQAGAFIEKGSVVFAKNPWATGNNSETLSDVGISLHWTKPEQGVQGSVYFAHKLTNYVATSATDANWRLWATLTKYF